MDRCPTCHRPEIMTLEVLTCNRCGKTVSTGFFSIPTDTPDKGIIIRAWIECPECIAERAPLDPEEKIPLTDGHIKIEEPDKIENHNQDGYDDNSSPEDGRHWNVGNESVDQEPDKSDSDK